MPFVLLFFLTIPHAQAERVRKVEVKGDQIVTVRTAVGVATIIQVPDRPTSLVVGDNESFKIEYLDQAITVKPLRGNAKSNLYIYTDWKRFNVQLATGPESSADYVVYLTTPMKTSIVPEPVHWKEIALESKSEDLRIVLKRFGRQKNEFAFVEFKIIGKKMDVDPAWFWVTQNSKTKPIHRLLLSRVSLDHDAPIEGLLQLRLKDISRHPLSIEIRRKKTLTVKVPEETIWR